MSVLHITKDNFTDNVLNSDVPVLVDFWAPWCGPCRMIAPVVEELSEDVTGKAVVAKVNVDEETELAQKFQVMSIPTLIAFKNGKAINKVVGFSDKNNLRQLLGV